MHATYTLMAGLMNVLEACRRIETWGLRGPGELSGEGRIFAALPSPYCPLVLLPHLLNLFQNGCKVCSGGGREAGSHPWACAAQADQVDGAHAAARKVLEDRFTSCRILLVARSPPCGPAQQL